MEKLSLVKLDFRKLDYEVNIYCDFDLKRVFYYVDFFDYERKFFFLYIGYFLSLKKYLIKSMKEGVIIYKFYLGEDVCCILGFLFYDIV